MKIASKIMALATSRRAALIGGVIVVGIASLLIFSSGEPKPQDAARQSNDPPAQTEKQEDKTTHRQTTAEQSVASVAPTADPQSEKALSEIYGSHDHCSKLEKACFSYAYPWTKKEINTGDPTKEEVQITSPNGTTIIWQYNTKDKLDGTCLPDEPTAYLNWQYIEHLVDLKIYTVSVGGYPPTHFGLQILSPKGADGLPISETGICTRLYIPTLKSHRNSQVLISLRTQGNSPVHKDDIKKTEAIIRSFRYE